MSSSKPFVANKFEGSQCDALRKVNEKEISVFSSEMRFDLTVVLS